MEKRQKWYCGILALTFIFILGSITSAAEFPTRPIEWLNPWGVGGITGLAMRIVGDRASKDFGVPVLIKPAPGGGGIVAASQVARAKPDGYTLLLAGSADCGNILYVRKDVPYKISDFEFIAGIGTFNLGLLVKADSPFKNLEDFVEYAKKNPFVIKAATVGFGSTAHLALEKFKLEAGGIKIDNVPYKISAELRTAVLGGHCQTAFCYGGVGGPIDQFTLALEGGGRFLAVTSRTRLKDFPNIPTFLERGFNVNFTTWYGIAGPKGMPKEVSQKLKDVFYRALKDPEVIQKVRSAGWGFSFQDSEEFTRMVEEYGIYIKKLVEEAKIPAE